MFFAEKQLFQLCTAEILRLASLALSRSGIQQTAIGASQRFILIARSDVALEGWIRSSQLSNGRGSQRGRGRRTSEWGCGGGGGELQYLTATDSQLTDFPKSRRWEARETERGGDAFTSWTVAELLRNAPFIFQISVVVSLIFHCFRVILWSFGA